jgi:hypothetical protein
MEAASIYRILENCPHRHDAKIQQQTQYQQQTTVEESEVITAMVMKDSIFWDSNMFLRNVG